MNSLYDITGDFLRLYEMAGEDEEAFADTLESLEFALEEKGRGYVQVMNQLDMEAEEAEKWSKAFAEKARIRRNCKKRMLARIQESMELLGKKELSAGEYTLKLKGNGGMQPLIIDGEVPDNMKKIIYENDNTKIRAFLKDNTCDWAHLGERGKHVEVK